MERNRRNLVRVLNGRLGEVTTEALVDYVHQALEDNNDRMYNTHLKDLATKDDLAKLELSTREQLARCATKEDVARLELATREQLAKCAMKDDLAKFATKDDLIKFATKDDLIKFPTKDDLINGFASKVDLKTEVSRLELGMANMHKDLEVKISNFKSDIARWMFALFVTMMLALLGLYFKK